MRVKGRERDGEMGPNPESPSAMGDSHRQAESGGIQPPLHSLKRYGTAETTDRPYLMYQFGISLANGLAVPVWYWLGGDSPPQA